MSLLIKNIYILEFKNLKYHLKKKEKEKKQVACKPPLDVVGATFGGGLKPIPAHGGDCASHLGWGWGGCHHPNFFFFSLNNNNILSFLMFNILIFFLLQVTYVAFFLGMAWQPNSLC